MLVSREEILADMELLRINLGDTRWVYHCHVEGCTEGPLTSWAAICSHVCWVHLGMKLPCAHCSQTFLTLTPSTAMASRCIPPGPQTLSKAYFVYFTPLKLCTSSV